MVPDKLEDLVPLWFRLCKSLWCRIQARWRPWPGKIRRLHPWCGGSCCRRVDRQFRLVYTLTRERSRHGMGGPGFVYALINPSMTGLVKVGRTERDPTGRAHELSSATGVP